MKLWQTIDGLEDDLKQAEGYLEELAQAPEEWASLSAVLSSSSVQRGKRLRPALVLLTGRLGPDYPACRDRLCRAAAMVELAHAASLIHDDIVDDSPLRRGRPTVQSRFGKDMAVYAGDFLLSRLFLFLMEQDMGRCGLLLARCMSDMCCGEIRQYQAQFNTEATEEAYFESLLGKTASLFAVSCELGALESGCGPKDIESLREFGRNLGVLFQLRDDLLDFTSSQQAEGKPVHSDFKQGLYTLPVLHGFQDPDVGPLLKEAARQVQRDGSDALCARMEELVARSGGIAYAVSVMEQYERQARCLLETLPPNPILKRLDSMIHKLVPGACRRPV